MQMDEFNDVLKLCEIKFEKRREKHGDSWKHCNIMALREKLEEEFNEYLEAFIVDEEIEELIDVINACLMLVKRLRR